MNLKEILADFSARGASLWVDGDELRVRAPKGSLTPQVRELLTERKAEIIGWLRYSNKRDAVDRLPEVIPHPEDRYQPFPLTEMQQAFWVGRSGVLELGDVANHGYYEIEGKNFNLERLNWALRKLIDRHDMLRAIVLPDGQQQVLAEVPDYEIEVFDLRSKDPDTVTSKLTAIRDRMSHQVLPFDRWPLFEFSITLLDGGRYRLHISYDLQIFDGWSLFRLFEEWFQLYQNPAISLPGLEISFRDYVLAEQTIKETELYTESQKYWFSRLDDFPPAPELPLVKNPQQLKHHRCQRRSAKLDSRLTQQLKERAARHGITPSGTLAAAFAEVLSRWSSTPRFTLNLALFNRLPLHPQVNDILGDFTSVTLLTVDNSAPESFAVRSARLQQQLWRDLEHRYISGVSVIRELTRRQGRTPTAMPVVFTSTLGFGELGQEVSSPFSHFGELIYGVSQASQVWIDHQVYEENGALKFNWDVVEELFPEGLMDDMFEAYCRFLEQLATGEDIWLQETAPQLLPPAQQNQRAALNATDAPISDKLLQVLFAEQATEQGDKSAVISSRRTLSYRELSELSNRLGRKLRELGAVPNKLVAIVMEKGWEQIVAVMAILNSGAAYLPIDPALPKERVWYLLENGEVEVVLTQSWLNERLEWPDNVRRISVGSDDLSACSAEPLESLQQPEDLAYVLYTSGSTGMPKGVEIAHRGVVNAVTFTNQFFQIGCDDKILALTALNHDMSVYDIFGILVAGGTIVMPEAPATRDPSAWSELMVRHQVTLWNSVPAMMEMLLDYAGDRSEALPGSLRWAFLGGDWISVTLPNRLGALVEGVCVVSVGGPTETTLWNIWYPVKAVNPDWKSIPYGQPIANTQYYVLNQALSECPTWVPGELCCTGVGLAKGYWRNEEKTRASFITHPITGDRLYRTGDLGRYLPDGNIEFLGRADFRIKIRGYRIEPGEIEAALMQHPEIHATIVTAIAPEDKHNNTGLVAYIVPENEPAPTKEEISNFLKDKIPYYMVPSALIFMDAFPLSANGKVDRRTLQTATFFQPISSAYIPPQNNLEKTIAKIWQEVLELDKVSTEDNFFELGGNSVSIITVFNQMKQRIPDEAESISVVDLFKHGTISSLAKYVNQKRAASDSSGASQEMADLEQRLSLGKERLKNRRKKFAMNK